MNEDRPADTVLTDAPAEGAESDPWDFDNAPATLPAEPPGPGGNWVSIAIVKRPSEPVVTWRPSLVLPTKTSSRSSAAAPPNGEAVRAVAET